MKKSLLSLAVAALLAAPSALATNAERVNVSLEASPGDLKVSVVPYPGSPLSGKVKVDDKLTIWQNVVIPIRVDGYTRGDGDANFVDELNVKIYAAFDAGKDADPVLLEKEVTYTEIPLSGKSSENKDWSEGRVNVGFFISPSNASKIVGPDAGNRIELKDKLIALAIEASFNGSPCMHPTKERFVIIDSKYKQKLTGKWWLKPSKNKSGAALSAISETPFAAFYYPIYPATKPMYGPATGSTGATPAGADGMTAGADTGTAADAPTDGSADAPVDTTADTTPTDTPTTKKDKKKKKKDK